LLGRDVSDGFLTLTVRDDGQGSGAYTVDELVARSHGIRGMRERAETIHNRRLGKAQPPTALMAVYYLTVMRPSPIGLRSYVATGKLWQLTWRVREIM
jgi:signal transduction histidine kinase